MPKFIIKYAPEALEEIQNNVSYYNHLLPGLGNRFKQNLLAAITLLKTNLIYNSFRYDKVRFTVVKKFPVAAHYTVDDNIIKIQAVLAFKQNNKTNWKIRF